MSARDHAARLVHRTSARLSARRDAETLRRAAGRGAALCYHRVLADDAPTDGIHPGMYVRASTLALHVRCLAEWGRIVPLVELFDPEPGPAGPRFALTFDDGWLDNADVAWPILAEASAPATVFLVRDWVERGTNGREAFMTPDRVAALHREGLSFGAHTATHPHLDREPFDRVVREMDVSKEAVETWTGRPCRAFAFPYGDHDATSIALARERFDHAWLTGDRWIPEKPDPGGIPRVCIHEDMTSTESLFRARLARTSR